MRISVIRQTGLFLACVFVLTLLVFQPFSTGLAADNETDAALVTEECTDSITVWDNGDGTHTARICLTDDMIPSGENTGEPERLEDSSTGGYGLENTGDATETLVNDDLAKGEAVAAIAKDEKQIRMIPVIPDDLPLDPDREQTVITPITETPSQTPAVAPVASEPTEQVVDPPSAEPTVETPTDVPTAESSPETLPDVENSALSMQSLTEQPGAETEIPQEEIIISTNEPSPSADPAPTPSIESAEPDIAPTPEASIDPQSTMPDPQLSTEKIGFDGSTYEGVKYENVFAEGMGIVLRPFVSGVKEDVVIEKYFGINRYTFILELTRMTPELVEKEIILKDKDGVETARIPAPFMVDASGVESRSIEVILEETNVVGEYKLTYVLDNSWLSDSDRAYPVTVDPSFYYDSRSSSNPAFEDNIVTLSTPYTVNDPAATNYQIGVRGSDETRAFIRVTLPSEMTGCTVLNFTWHLYVNSAGGTGGNFRVVPVNEGWSADSITYFGPPNGNMNWDARYEVYKDNLTPGWNELDITKVASAWYNPWEKKPNYGFMMNSDGGASGGENWINVASSVAAANKMYFTVTYAIPKTATDNIKATPYGNALNSGTGYITLTWNDMFSASYKVKGYYVGIFNGSTYQLIDVGNVTTWSTRNKGIWPTDTEVYGAARRYKLHIDDSTHLVTSGGTELPCSPNTTYANAGTTYANNINYMFKVIPYNQFGHPADINSAPVVTAVLPDRVEPIQPTSVSIVPTDWTNQTSHTLSWAGITDRNGLSVLSSNWGVVEYSFDNTTSWISTGIRNGTYNNFTVSTASLGDGQHTIYVRGKDDAGNTGAPGSAIFKIDRTGPTQPTLTLNPSSWTNLDSVNLSWDDVTDPRGVNRIELKIDSDAWGSLELNDGTYVNWPLDVSLLADGTHTISLRGVDNIGNEGTVGIITLYRDVTIPQVGTVTATPASWTKQDYITIDWAGFIDSTSGVSKIEYRIDGQATWIDTASVTDTGSFVLDMKTLADGEHEIQFKVTDKAGNVNDTAKVKVYRDITPPHLAITYPVNDDYVAGLLEIWGNVEDIAIDEWILTAVGSSGKTVEIARGTESGIGLLLGVVNIDQFLDGEVVNFYLSAKDKAGNESKIGGAGSVTAVTVDKSAKPVTSEVIITSPQKGVVITEPQTDVTWSKTYAGTEQKAVYYVDKTYIDQHSGGSPFVFDAILYDDKTSHTLAIISQDTTGMLHYSGGLVAYMGLSDAFDSNEHISSQSGISFTSAGTTITGGSGTLISTPATITKNIMALRLTTTQTVPSGASIKYYYSVDSGGTWQSITPGIDAYIQQVTKSVILKAEFAGGASKPLLQGWQLECISEQNGHVVTTNLMGKVQPLTITSDVMTVPSQPVEYTSPVSLVQPYLLVDGLLHSEIATFDTLAYAERTTHGISVIGKGTDGIIYAGSGAQMNTLLRKTEYSSGEVIRTINSTNPLVTLRLLTSQVGSVAYSVSVDSGQTWLDVSPGEPCYLPKESNIVILRAIPQNGGVLNAWYMEGVSIGRHNVWVEMVDAPTNFHAVPTKGQNVLTWKESATWGATYNLKCNGDSQESGIRGSKYNHKMPDQDSDYVLTAQVTFPEPWDYDPNVHILTRESRPISTSAHQKNDTQARIDIYFEPEEADAAKEWAKSGKEAGENWVISELNDPYSTEDKSELQEVLEASQALDTDSLFIGMGDDTVLKAPLADCTLTFDDGTVVTTDNDGYYYSGNISRGEHEVLVVINNVPDEDSILSQSSEQSTAQSAEHSMGSMEFAYIKIELSDTNIGANETVVDLTTQDINDAMDRMAEGMGSDETIDAMSSEQMTESDDANTNPEMHEDSCCDQPMVSASSSDGGTIGIYNGQLATDGNTIIGTMGRGTTRYVSEESTIVYCVKTDTTLSDSVKFPFNKKADCARSIWLGIQASLGPIERQKYYNSLHCYAEACNNDLGGDSLPHLTNNYCNGSNSTRRDGQSKDGHTNCSWFNGIKHPEEMHIHAELFLNISEPSWAAASISGTKSIVVTTNYNYWDAKSSASWLTVSPTHSVLGESLTIRVSANATGSQRIGYITISTGQGSLQKTIKVTQNVASHIHSYPSNPSRTVQPTCIPGYNIFTCTGCGYQLQKSIPAVSDHKYPVWTTTIFATCTTNGLQSRTCTVCKTKNSELIPAMGHRYVNSHWEKVKGATCTSEGQEKRRCDRLNCGYYLTRQIAKKPHTYPLFWTTTKSATCTTNGKKEKICTSCNSTKLVETIPAFGHAYAYNWKTVQSPTCSESGLKKRPCLNNCGHYDYASIDRKPHTLPLLWEVGKSATCTVNGYRYKICSVCNMTVTETLAATGHSYPLAWSVSSNPTCTSSGSRYKVCKTCGGGKITETMAAHGHSYTGSIWKTVTAATCTASGLKKRACSYGCGHYEYAAIDRKSHSYATGSWENVRVSSTCRRRLHKCTGCSDYYWEYDYSHYFINKTCWNCGYKK